jgi:hypothetical protein
MTIDKTMKIEVRCKRHDCPNTFTFDTEAWPPQLYCSTSCSGLQRTRKWREKHPPKKKDAPPPQGDSSGTAPADAPKPHGDTPESSPGSSAPTAP